MKSDARSIRTGQHVNGDKSIMSVFAHKIRGELFTTLKVCQNKLVGTEVGRRR